MTDHAIHDGDDARATTDDVRATTDDVRATTDDVRATTDDVRATTDDVRATTDVVGATTDDVRSTTDDATVAFSAEEDAAEYSPAQPEGAHRIDDDGARTAADPGPAHIKHEHTGRMTH